ncbi:protoheme IX farnesyltransferase, partial [Leucogyrophana mollusca]
MKGLIAFSPCSRRFPKIRISPRSFLASRSNFDRSYSTSALRKRDFASFFYHNELWSDHHTSPPMMEKRCARHSTHAVTDQSLASSNYRETEVLTPRRLLRLYGQLSKSRLTTLVVLTAMSGVALSPLPTTLPVLLSTAVGTAMCSASANTLNQLQEVPYDAQMARTRMRPIVRRAITPLHATGFAIATGVAGPAILWIMVSPVTAALGAVNIGLYAGVYTWLKRKSILNTWVGAVVGGLPPLMGWTACGGKLLPLADYPFQFFLPSFLSPSPQDISLVDNPLSPIALFMLLYSWQFPHFMAFSHQVRASYAQAGYKMLSVLSPHKNTLVALRHALLLVPICSVLFPLSGLTTWTFALTSLIPNAVGVRAAWGFWRRGGEKEARAVWQHSLWYLPVILALTMVHKQGMEWTEWTWKR